MKINTDVLRLNQGNGGGIDFRGKLAMKDGKSSQSQVADRCESSVMNTERTALCTMSRLNFCDHVSCRKLQ